MALRVRRGAVAFLAGGPPGARLTVVRWVVGLLLFACMLSVPAQRSVPAFDSPEVVAPAAAPEAAAEAPLPSPAGSEDSSDDGGDELMLVAYPTCPPGAGAGPATTWWLVPDLHSVVGAVVLRPPIA